MRNCVVNIMMIDEVPADVPRNIVTSADNTSPSGRKTRGVAAVGNAAHQELRKPVGNGVRRERDAQVTPWSKPISTRWGMASVKFLRTR